MLSHQELWICGRRVPPSAGSALLVGGGGEMGLGALLIEEQALWAVKPPKRHSSAALACPPGPPNRLKAPSACKIGPLTSAKLPRKDALLKLAA